VDSTGNAYSLRTKTRLLRSGHGPATIRGILLAGMWQLEMHTWENLAVDQERRYISKDGGTKWTKLAGHGLPKSPLGKIGRCDCAYKSERLFALIQTKDQGSLWRSDDGGEHWQAVNFQRQLIGRAGYYIRIAVSTRN